MDFEVQTNMAKSLVSNFQMLKRYLFILSLLLSLGSIVSAEIRPIALDRVEGSLYVLNADGSVAALSKDGGEYKRILTIPPELQAADIVSAEREGKIELVIVASMKGPTPTGRVLKYSLEGQLQQSWTLPFSPLNADIDPRSNVLYLTAGASGEIFSVDLKQTASVTRLATVQDSRLLGPIVFVQATNHLFAADIFTGNLFDIDVGRKQSTLVSQHFGQVTSMSLDPTGRLLYIADSAGRRLLTYSLSNRLLVRSTTYSRLLQITSVASSYEKDKVWVGDRASGAVYIVSPNGAIISRIGKLTIQAAIGQADDNLRMVLDGQEVLSWERDHSDPKTIGLEEGNHNVELLVFNKRSYTGGISFLGGHVPEGWNFQFKMFDSAGRESVSVAEQEDKPDENGPRFGKEFLAAKFSFSVDSIGGISVTKLDSKIWQH
jgi:hypothetical protein